MTTPSSGPPPEPDAPGGTPVLQARRITRVYRMGEVDVHALRGVDFDLFEGEFLVLLGASGSGKSTLREAVRLGCRRCGAVKQAKVAFAPGRHRYTRRFARHALDLTRAMTMSDVARHLGERWNVVKAILKTDLERRFRRPKLQGLRRIATPEVSIERGHRCLTIVLDLDSGAVVFVGEGKGVRTRSLSSTASMSRGS
jgi:hypothetical protein